MNDMEEGFVVGVIMTILVELAIYGLIRFLAG